MTQLNRTSEGRQRRSVGGPVSYHIRRSAGGRGAVLEVAVDPQAAADFARRAERMGLRQGILPQIDEDPDGFEQRALNLLGSAAPRLLAGL